MAKASRNKSQAAPTPITMHRNGRPIARSCCGAIGCNDCVISMLQPKRSHSSIKTNSAKSKATTGRPIVSGSSGHVRKRTTCLVSIFTRSPTNSRRPSLIVGMALARQSSATMENMCCSPQPAISSRHLATKNLQMCIATCSGFISSHSPKKPPIHLPRRAMKSARLKKNDKKKKRRNPKRKSRKKRSLARNPKKNQRNQSL